MKTSSIVWIVVVVLVVIIGGYFWWASMSSSPYATNNPAPTITPTSTANTGSNPSAPTTPTTATTTSNPPVLTLSTSNGDTMGPHLVAANGMTLYEYNKDTADVSNCTGGCATAWPPYTVSAEQAASLGGGVNVTGKIGTMTRADGTLQVTYDNLPLYFFSGDTKAGDTNGQGVNGFSTITSE